MQMADRSEAGRWYRSRWFLPLLAVALGAVIWAVQAKAGDGRGGAISFAIMFLWAAGLFTFSNRSEVVAILSGRARDERYQGIDLQAIAIMGTVLVAVILGGFIWELGHGRNGTPYTWLGALAGLTYIGAIVYQRFRG